MNSYLSSVFTTEDYVNFPTQDCIVDKKLANIDCCVDEVKCHLLKLKPNKSPGPDHIAPRLDFQPFSEPAFLAPHHGWITSLPIVFLDQSQRSLLKSSRLPCDWSILSLVYRTWRISVRMIFLLLESVCYSAPISRNLEKHNRKPLSIC